MIQLISIAATVAYTAVATAVVVVITRAATGGLRVNEEDEVKGLDAALHGERAFDIQ
jgi:Amt family ammonium transporter